MRYIVLLIIAFPFLPGCVQEPVDIDNAIECIPDSFVGVWEYQSTDGIVLDSIPDIIIELSNAEKQGDLLINGRYHYINTVAGCTAGDASSLLNVTYELSSTDELHKRTNVLLFFGSTDVFKRKQ
ncbi:MAG: hypothetical protein R2830_09780 [Saprospiraceae bacterium]